MRLSWGQIKLLCAHKTVWRSEGAVHDGSTNFSVAYPSFKDKLIFVVKGRGHCDLTLILILYVKNLAHVALCLLDFLTQLQWQL